MRHTLTGSNRMAKDFGTPLWQRVVKDGHVRTNDAARELVRFGHVLVNGRITFNEDANVLSTDTVTIELDAP